MIRKYTRIFILFSFNDFFWYFELFGVCSLDLLAMKLKTPRLADQCFNLVGVQNHSENTFGITQKYFRNHSEILENNFENTFKITRKTMENNCTIRKEEALIIPRITCSDSTTLFLQNPLLKPQKALFQIMLMYVYVISITKR